MISAETACALLDLDRPIALRVEDMARSLQVTFSPVGQPSARSRGFLDRLQRALGAAGAEVLPYDAATATPRGKVRQGVVTVAGAEFRDGDLPIDHVGSLLNNLIVGVYDRPCPVSEEALPQERLDALSQVMGEDIVHLPIFVTDESWTLCTMPGAIIEQRQDELTPERVLELLVPKLSGQVVPPQLDRFECRAGALVDPAGAYSPLFADFTAAARAWSVSDATMAHTPVERLKLRSDRYRRLVRQIIDDRTGMSYGFMAWQLPTHLTPALRESEAAAALRGWDWERHPLCPQGGEVYARVMLGEAVWLVQVPEVSVLVTRSGCNKGALRPDRDLVRMGFRPSASRPVMRFDTPPGIDPGDCKPSYDTKAIFAHAFGNAIVGSLLLAHDAEAPFARSLQGRGLSIVHWHGYPEEVPEGQLVHGYGNPPVSCSTPQSAVYALHGKLSAFEARIRTGQPYLGDVHIEPYHGTNVSSNRTLRDTLAWVDTVSTRNGAGIPYDLMAA